jgi:hypothetical protein
MGIDQKACLVWDEAAVERTLCMSLMDALVLEDGFVVGSTAEFIATVWAAGEQPGKTGAPAHCFTECPVKYLKFPRCALSQVVQEVIELPLLRLPYETMEQNELPPETRLAIACFFSGRGAQGTSALLEISGELNCLPSPSSIPRCKLHPVQKRFKFAEETMSRMMGMKQRRGIGCFMR